MTIHNLQWDKIFNFDSILRNLLECKAPVSEFEAHVRRFHMLPAWLILEDSFITLTNVYLQHE